MVNRQVVFTEPLRVALQEREVAEPGPGQALVRTRRSLISTGTELTVLRGGHAPGSNWASFAFPFAAGYCNVGIVVQAGPGVTTLKPGDRVASTGPHASLFVLDEDELHRIPDAVTDEEALFATIAQIVMQGVRLADLTLGESAVVCGLGLLGQLVVAFARFAGGWPVLGVDLEPFRREAALARGATTAAEPQEAEAMIREHTGGEMADVVFEVTGNPAVIPQEIPWLRRMGRLVIVSSPRGPTTMDFHDLVNARGTVIIGAHNFTHPAVPNPYNRWTRRADTRLYLRLVEAGQLVTQGLLTDRFPADRAPEAYDRLLSAPACTLAVSLEWDDR